MKWSRSWTSPLPTFLKPRVQTSNIVIRIIVKVIIFSEHFFFLNQSHYYEKTLLTHFKVEIKFQWTERKVIPRFGRDWVICTRSHRPCSYTHTINVCSTYYWCTHGVILTKTEIISTITPSPVWLTRSSRATGSLATERLVPNSISVFLVRGVYGFQ